MRQVVDGIGQRCARLDSAVIDGPAQDLLNDGGIADRAAAARGLSQRAQDLLGDTFAGNQAVKPADRDALQRLEPKIHAPHLKVVASGEESSKILQRDDALIFQVSLGRKGKRFIHVVEYSTVFMQYVGDRKKFIKTRKKQLTFPGKGGILAERSRETPIRIREVKQKILKY